MSTPIIFLDFDGVIRVAPQGGFITADAVQFCQHRMELLGGVCRETGAKIVVSSDWRNMENLHEIIGHLTPHLHLHLHADWATPICGHRWNECERWLRDHPEVSRYAILEDFLPHFDGCPADMASRLILCSNRHGLVPELIPRFLALL